MRRQTTLDEGRRAFWLRRLSGASAYEYNGANERDDRVPESYQISSEQYDRRILLVTVDKAMEMLEHFELLGENMAGVISDMRRGRDCDHEGIGLPGCITCDPRIDEAARLWRDK